MKRKLIGTILCVSMTAGLLVGCGSSGSSSGGTTTGAVSGDGVTTTSYGEYTTDNPYHLVFEYIEFYEQDDDARAAVQDALNDYMIENYQIEVEFLPVSYADYQTTTQLMLSGGDELDVIPIFYSYAPSWVNMGGIYDMTDLLETEDGQKIIEALGSEETAKVGSVNGVLFGFPANKESVELGGLCMRADICDELGLTEKYNLDAENSDTYTGTSIRWEDAEEIFAAVKEAYPNMYPLYLYNSSQYNRFTEFDTLVDSFGVIDLSEDRENTTVVNMFETEQYKEYVTMIADWYDKGYIYPDAATDTQGTATMMKAGNTFSYATAIKPGFLAEANSANGCECYCLYINPSDEGYLSTTNISFFDTGIANNSKDPEMAFKFISALYSDPTVYNMWQYGIEGVNYQLLDDGTAYFVDGEDGSNYTYHQNTGWCLGNQFQSYVWNDGTKDADYWSLLQSHNDWAYYPATYGFMWDSSDYSTEITALTNAYETYRATLETGAAGSAGVQETLDKMNEALYAAGLEDVMNAKQEQLDEWLASK